MVGFFLFVWIIDWLVDVCVDEGVWMKKNVCVVLYMCLIVVCVVC